MTFEWPSWVDLMPLPFPELHNNSKILFPVSSKSFESKRVAYCLGDQTSSEALISGHSSLLLKRVTMKMTAMTFSAPRAPLHSSQCTDSPAGTGSKRWCEVLFLLTSSEFIWVKNVDLSLQLFCPRTRTLLALVAHLININNEQLGTWSGASLNTKTQSQSVGYF